MKKVLSVILTFALVFTMNTLVNTSVFAAESEGLKYTVSNSKAQITGYTLPLTFNQTLPSTLGGYPVTSIGDYAFSGLGGLSKIIIPISVTSIGNYAFQSCTGLTSMIIPNAVTSIGDYSFRNCSGLTSMTMGTGLKSIGDSAFQECSGLSSVTIGNSVVSIGETAFKDCTGLIILSIGNGVTSIGEEAFKNCIKMTNMILGSGIKSIGANAFLNCIKLGSVNIPNSLITIGDYAFQGCGLTSVTMGSGVTSIGTWAFESNAELTKFTVASSNAKYSSQDGVLFDKVKKTLIQCPSKKKGSYIVPNSVTYVGGSSFKKCTGLSKVTIGSGVTSIGDYAFWGCSTLTSAHFLGNAPKLFYSVFDKCASSFKIYYLKGKTGFTNPWNGYPTVGENSKSPAKPATPKVSILKANSIYVKGTAAKGSTVYAKINTKTYSAKANTKTGVFSVKIPKIKKGTSVVVYCKSGGQTSGKKTVKAV